MPWIYAAAAIGSAVIGSQASKSAADSAKKSSDRAADVQWDIYSQTREDFAPWRETGAESLDTLSAMLLGGDQSLYMQSPGYQWQLEQGQQAIDRQAAATGQYGTGAHSKDLIGYSQGLASQDYNTYVNQLAALAGIGQTATGSTAAAGQNYANMAGNAYMMGGQAQAAGTLGQANAWGSAINSLGYLYGSGQFGGSTNYNPYGYGTTAQGVPVSQWQPTF